MLNKNSPSFNIIFYTFVPAKKYKKHTEQINKLWEIIAYVYRKENK